MKTIYVSVPWRDINSNSISYQICKKIIKIGHNPVCWPVMHSSLFDFSDVKERDRAVEASLLLLPACSEIWVFGTAKTPTMEKELEMAEKHNIPVFSYSVLDFIHGSR